MDYDPEHSDLDHRTWTCPHCEALVILKADDDDPPHSCPWEEY